MFSSGTVTTSLPRFLRFPRGCSQSPKVLEVLFEPDCYPQNPTTSAGQKPEPNSENTVAAMTTVPRPIVAARPGREESGGHCSNSLDTLQVRQGRVIESPPPGYFGQPPATP